MKYKFFRTRQPNGDVYYFLKRHYIVGLKHLHGTQSRYEIYRRGGHGACALKINFADTLIDAKSKCQKAEESQ